MSAINFALLKKELDEMPYLVKKSFYEWVYSFILSTEMKELIENPVSRTISIICIFIIFVIIVPRIEHWQRVRNRKKRLISLIRSTVPLSVDDIVMESENSKNINRSGVYIIHNSLTDKFDINYSENVYVDTAKYFVNNDALQHEVFEITVIPLSGDMYIDTDGILNDVRTYVSAPFAK